MNVRGHDDSGEIVEVNGRKLKLRRLQKLLYPETSTTKAEVLDYYARIAPVMLPHLADRPVTRIRWPDGTGSTQFFEKNVPAHTPDWIRTVVLASPGSSHDRDTVRYPLFDDIAALIWAANLAALELHVTQWTVGPRGKVHHPNRLVIDLDPGEPAGLAECASVALHIRERLSADGLTAVPVTSGSKGMQLYVALAGTQDADNVIDYAKRLADSLAADLPDLVVAKMTKTLRPGKVLLDWSQNNPAKTTICPYSLRGRAQPWVAAPRGWGEIADGDLEQLSAKVVLDRMVAQGDLAKGLLDPAPRLPA